MMNASLFTLEARKVGAILVASLKQMCRASQREFCELNLLLASCHFATLIVPYVVAKIRQRMLQCMFACDLCHTVEMLCDISLCFMIVYAFCFSEPHLLKIFYVTYL